MELFASLPADQLRDLARRIPDVGVAKGQIFYTPWHRSESFFFLLKSRMRMYRVRGAREVTVSVKHPGEIFGEASRRGCRRGRTRRPSSPRGSG